MASSNNPSVDPSVPKGFVALPFLMPGAFDERRRFGLEVLAKLPADAKLMLEIPLGPLGQFGERHQQCEIDRERKVARLRLRPSGRHALPLLNLRAKSRNRLRLLVAFPDKLRQHSYQVAARQIWEHEELGRVTWMLAPKGKAKV